jgi:hypothetical protein
MTVLDPCGSKSTRIDRLAHRPRTLHGARVAFFDNLKPNASALLEQVATRLLERFDLGAVMTVSKRTPTGPATEALQADLERNDFVVLGVADCGGCTAWTIHDAIELERHGVPTVTFASQAFIPLAQSQASLRGVNELPLVRVPHPFSLLATEEVTKCVDELMDCVVQAMVPASAGSHAFLSNGVFERARQP